MTTTVQVKDETRRILDRLKRELGLNSYDEVISRLVRKRTGSPESLFGACKGSEPFIREKEDEHRL
jgi:predicted CopG family antitoxin